jgi:hypothetical protein
MFERAVYRDSRDLLWEVTTFVILHRRLRSGDGRHVDQAWCKAAATGG